MVGSGISSPGVCNCSVCFFSFTSQLGRRIDTCVVIYDMEGLSIQKHFAPKGEFGWTGILCGGFRER